jgi:RecQ family ATP-dependent DNA helicase
MALVKIDLLSLLKITYSSNNYYMNDYKKTLKKYFGFDDFRDKQLEIIKYILEDKRDVCCIMFTGSGKSLCFQLPAVHTNKITIIISPLISLMNDQQNKMDELKIPTCRLNSTIDNKIKLKKEILQNKYRLVYTTPEYLTKQQSFVEQLVEKDLLLNFCIDEVHVLSLWSGTDFRESYKQLNCLREWAPNIQISTFTATATKRVQCDVINALKLKNVATVTTTFDRSNLFIKLKPKGPDPMKDILPLLKEDEQTLLFCQTRKMVDNLSQLLKDNNVLSEAYHAGLGSTQREEIHNKFTNKEITCLCCTNAYGLGVSVTVDTVIHYFLPSTIDEYVQEMGRIRNMEKKSYCYLLYSLSDITTNNYFINQTTNVAYRNNQLQLALVMKNYIFTSQCRRKYILEYFGEEYKKDNCGACDNCLNKKNIVMYDFAKEAALLFQVSNLTNNIYGGGMLVNVLRGSGSKKIPAQFKKSKLFGSGKDHTEKWWKMLLMLLINDGYFKEKPISGGHAFTLSLTSKAISWLTTYKQNDKTELNLSMPEDMVNLKKPKATKKTVTKKVAKKALKKDGVIVLDD